LLNEVGHPCAVGKVWLFARRDAAAVEENLLSAGMDDEAVSFLAVIPLDGTLVWPRLKHQRRLWLLPGLWSRSGFHSRLRATLYVGLRRGPAGGAQLRRCDLFALLCLLALILDCEDESLPTLLADYPGVLIGHS